MKDLAYVDSVKLMASAAERVDQPSRDLGLDAFGFLGAPDGYGSPVLELPGFDGRRSETPDGEHFEVVTKIGDRELSAETLEAIRAALGELDGVSFEFVEV